MSPSWAVNGADQLVSSLRVVESRVDIVLMKYNIYICTKLKSLHGYTACGYHSKQIGSLPCMVTLRVATIANRK